MFRTFTFSAVIAALLVQPVGAHEYFLMPDNFSAPSTNEVVVRHRLGQKFKGNELPYISSWNIRSEVWEDAVKHDVKGRDGDRPALKFAAKSNGLMIVAHQSNIDFLTFKTWEKFQKYTKKEGLTHALSASEKGKKPKLGLKEAYARYAKTLISVDGSTKGMDQPIGLKIELVALAHPLLLAAGEPMPGQVLYEGKPLSGARVKVFVGLDTEFAHQILTDKNGKAMIPADGPGPYLLNAIHMTEPQSNEALSAGAHWESFWASLTFERKQ